MLLRRTAAAVATRSRPAGQNYGTTPAGFARWPRPHFLQSGSSRRPMRATEGRIHRWGRWKPAPPLGALPLLIEGGKVISPVVLRNRMEKDEQEIRELVETWMAATKAGDVEAVLGLMTDDVVFLVPGQPPMGRAEFAAAA